MKMLELSAHDTDVPSRGMAVLVVVPLPFSLSLSLFFEMLWVILSYPTYVTNLFVIYLRSPCRKKYHETFHARRR